LGWAAHTHAKFIFFVYKAKEVATLPLDWKEANHLHDDLLLKKKNYMMTSKRGQKKETKMRTKNQNSKTRQIKPWGMFWYLHALTIGRFFFFCNTV
jgi:hypothetical protein